MRKKNGGHLKVHPVRLPYSPKDTWKFVLVGDFHYGSQQCDIPLMKKFVEKYAGKEKTKIILMGDEIDAIARSDKRYDSMAVHDKYRGSNNFVDLIIEDFIEIMKPLRGQILAGVDSNHNKVYRKVSDSDPHYRISRALEFTRLGYGGWVPILWWWHKGGKKGGRTRSTVFHVTHGKPTFAVTPGGALNTIFRDSQFFDCDVLAHGHTHRLSAGSSVIKFELDRTMRSYRKKKQHLLQTGSFLKSYSVDSEFSPYSEVKRYPPIDLGWAVVDVCFEPDEPRVRCWVEEH